MCELFVIKSDLEHMHWGKAPLKVLCLLYCQRLGETTLGEYHVQKVIRREAR